MHECTHWKISISFWAASFWDPATLTLSSIFSTSACLWASSSILRRASSWRRVSSSNLQKAFISDQLHTQRSWGLYKNYMCMLTQAASSNTKMTRGEVIRANSAFLVPANSSSLVMCLCFFSFTFLDNFSTLQTYSFSHPTLLLPPHCSLHNGLLAGYGLTSPQFLENGLRTKQWTFFIRVETFTFLFSLLQRGQWQYFWGWGPACFPCNFLVKYTGWSSSYSFLLRFLLFRLIFQIIVYRVMRILSTKILEL